MRNAGEILQLDLASLLLIDDHAELHGLLDLFALLLVGLVLGDISGGLHRFQQAAWRQDLVCFAEASTGLRFDIFAVFDSTSRLFIQVELLHQSASLVLAATQLLIGDESCTATLHQRDSILVKAEILRQLHIINLICHVHFLALPVTAKFD